MRLIDADALKESIRCSDTDEPKVLPPNKLHKVLTEWIDKRPTIEERKTGKWIPVSERLPEKCGVYLVSGGNKVWLCEWVHIAVVHGWSNDVGNPMVIAWMPLPEPVKGRKEDGKGKEE